MVRANGGGAKGRSRRRRAQFEGSHRSRDAPLPAPWGPASPAAALQGPLGTLPDPLGAAAAPGRQHTLAGGFPASPARAWPELRPRAAGPRRPARCACRGVGGGLALPAGPAPQGVSAGRGRRLPAAAVRRPLLRLPCRGPRTHHAAPCRPPPSPTRAGPPPGAADAVFVVEQVLQASGGRTGCFLYRGRVVSGAAAPWAATPDCARQLPRAPSVDSLLAGVQEVPQCDGADGDSLAACEGRSLTLYLRWAQGRGWRGAACGCGPLR